jgi:hypothetical protein
LGIDYTIGGTIEEIADVLEKDFSLSSDEAKFSTYVLVSQMNDKVKINSEDFKLWYLGNDAKYTASVFNTHYSISISDLKIGLLKKLFVVAAVFLFTKEAGFISLGAETLVLLSECIKHIEDEEYCVFSLAVKKGRGNNRGLLTTEDLVPNRDCDGECTYRCDKWRCPYLRGDNCIIKEDNVVKIIDKLCEKSVLEKIDNCWKVKF